MNRFFRCKGMYLSIDTIGMYSSSTGEISSITGSMVVPALDPRYREAFEDWIESWGASPDVLDPSLWEVKPEVVEVEVVDED